MATYTAVATVTGGRAGHATSVNPDAEFDISAPAQLGGTLAWRTSPVRTGV